MTTYRLKNSQGRPLRAIYNFGALTTKIQRVPIENAEVLARPVRDSGRRVRLYQTEKGHRNSSPCGPFLLPYSQIIALRK
jgi:hypothetical protein